MLTVKTFTGPDRFGGTGLFAAEDIPAGAVVWRYDPAYTHYIPFGDIKKFSPAARTELEHFCYPVYMPEEKPKLIGVLLNRDNARYSNHSDDPNTGHDARDASLNIALRDIKAGEEMTCDYFEFDPENKIHARGAKTCKSFLLDGSVLETGTQHA